MSPQDKAPAYQWYVRDFMSDEAVALMSYEQQGIYRALLDRQWLEGSIPADPSQLAAILRIPGARFKKLWPEVSVKFKPTAEGRIANPRMERERQKAEAFRQAKAQAGAIGGKSRFAHGNDALRKQRLRDARAIATHTKDEWKEMVAFFGGGCVKCGRTDMPVEADHIKPIYQGGHDGISNIQPLCAPCNGAKGPEAVDYRQANGKQMPSKWQANPSSSSSSSSASASTTAKRESETAAATVTPFRRNTGPLGGSYAAQSMAAVASAWSHPKGFTLAPGRYYSKLLANFDGNAPELHGWMNRKVDEHLSAGGKVGDLFKFFDAALDADFGLKVTQRERAMNEDF